MSNLMTAEDIVALIQKTICDWHVESESRPSDYKIVTDEIRRIRPMNEHREDLRAVVEEILRGRLMIRRSCVPKEILIRSINIETT